MGCMTQPVGRVLDTRAERRFWLRANPLVCAGDILHYFIRILIDYHLEPCWSWRHFRGALADRFRDTDWSAPRPESFERAALGRWALLVLGGIPCQTIKLMAMRGIPVTQSLALVYAVALVFGEALNIAAEASLRSSSARPPVRPQPSPARQKLLSAPAHVFLLLLQVLPASGLVLMLAIIADMKNWNSSPFVWSLDGAIEEGMLPISWSLMAAIVFGTVAIVLTSDLDDDSYIGEWFVAFVPFQLLTLVVPPLLRQSFWRDLDSLSSNELLTMVTVTVILGSLLVSPLCWLGFIAFQHLGRNRLGEILGVPRRPSELCCLMSFLFLLLVSVLSYAYAFDGAGTVNPSWLGIFG